MQILALDLARTAGWCLGTPADAKPLFGTIEIVRENASMAKLFCEWRILLRDFLSMNPDITLVVFEAPLPPNFVRGNTTFDTTRRLLGLCAVTEELLYSLAKYDIREARVSDVRNHFLGSNRYKRPEAKLRTIRRCHSMGWNVADDNQGDAVALWDYQVACLRKAHLLSRAK